MTTFADLVISVSVTVASLMLGVGRPTAQLASSEPLQLEAKIPLGEVRGRIDHMAVDLVRQRVFVAELGNNSVGIVDLQKREAIQTISGLLEPQGLGYLPATDSLYIANAGDGSVRVFAGANYAAAGRIDLGEDADNIRVDAAAGQIVVGYGSGGLAAIDARTLQRMADIPLPVHPEGFQLDPASSQVFVNLPKAHAIAAVDRRTGKLTASWPVAIAGDNFPMALRRDAGEILTVFRNPAKLAAFSITDGALLASADVCGDADDLFFDPQRQRVYVSCGEGFLDVLDAKESAYKPVARIATAPGARTSLFVPELDRLLLAVRAEAEQPASIWVFRPTP
jgi:DNA-binding beta-propeller fold protein YncE